MQILDFSQQILRKDLISKKFFEKLYVKIS